MATIWVDSYINTPSGGAAGTTGSGSGTYASPYTLADLANSSIYNTFADGDEIRFKGIAEATQFNSPVTTTKTGTQFLIESGDRGKLFKYTNVYNDTNYASVQTSQTGFNLFTLTSGSIIKYLPEPINLQYTPLNSNYQLSLTGTTHNWFGTGSTEYTTALTITAGWDSETTQNGITIISGSTYNINIGVGSNTPHNTTANRWKMCPNIDFDCRNTMIISTAYDEIDMQWSVGDLKIHSIVSGFDQVNGNEINIAVNGNNIDAHQLPGGNTFSNIKLYGSGTLNVTCNYTQNSYSSDTFCMSVESSTSYGSGAQNVIYRIKYIHSYKTCNFGFTSIPRPGSSAEWVYVNGCQFVSNVSLKAFGPTGDVNGNFHEWTLTTEGTPNTDISWAIGTNNYDIISRSLNNTYSIGGYGSNGRAFFDASRDFELPSNEFEKLYWNYNGYDKTDHFRNFITTTTLESITDFPVFYASANVDSPGMPTKVRFIQNTKDFRPLYFMKGYNAYTNWCMVYRNTNYSNKITWHMPANCAGSSFADTFEVPMVDYSANNLTFGSTLQQNVGSDYTISVKLYGWAMIGGEIKLIRTITPSFSSGTATISETLTSKELLRDGISSMYVIVDVTCNSTAQSDFLAFADNAFTLTQI